MSATLADNKIPRAAEAETARNSDTPWYKDARFWVFIAILGLYHGYSLASAATDSLNEYGESGAIYLCLMLTHPVFSTMLPVLACAALRSISRLITLVLLNAVCIVPLFFMKGGFPAAFCLPYLVPLVAFGVSTCLTARFLRQHSTGLCPLWKVVAGFLVLMLCFYLWVGRYIDIAQSEGDIVGALMAIILYVCLYHPALSLVTQIVFSRKVKQRTFFWIPSAMSFLLGTLFPILDFPDSVYPEALYASIVFLVSMTVGFFISFCSVGRKRGIDNVSKNE